MLGDLTNAGIWGVCIFVGYKLIVFTGTTASIVYVIKLVVTTIYNSLKSDFTKADAEALENDYKHKRNRDDDIVKSANEARCKAEQECNEVKSMYKILKQKHEAKDESL